MFYLFFQEILHGLISFLLIFLYQAEPKENGCEFYSFIELRKTFRLVSCLLLWQIHDAVSYKNVLVWTELTAFFCSVLQKMLFSLRNKILLWDEFNSVNKNVQKEKKNESMIVQIVKITYWENIISCEFFGVIFKQNFNMPYHFNFGSWWVRGTYCFSVGGFLFVYLFGFF